MGMTQESVNFYSILSLILIENEILNASQFTAEELEYIEEIKLMLENDGEIGEGDRKILKRLSVKLNISEQRALEIEQFILNSDKSENFSDAELKYVEELKFCFEDGPEITVSGRRLLNKERENLGISEERALEIEKIIKNQK